MGLLLGSNPVVKNADFPVAAGVQAAGGNARQHNGRHAGHAAHLFLALGLEFMQAGKRGIDLYQFLPLFVQEHQALIAPRGREEFGPGHEVGAVVFARRGVHPGCGIIRLAQRLDDIVPERPGAFGLKIDAEGFEKEVLLGATRVLKQCNWVVCEASMSPRFVGDPLFAGIYRILDKAGFVFRTTIFSCLLFAFSALGRGVVRRRLVRRRAVNRRHRRGRRCAR